VRENLAESEPVYYSERDTPADQRIPDGRNSFAVETTLTGGGELALLEKAKTD